MAINGLHEINLEKNMAKITFHLKVLGKGDFYLFLSIVNLLLKITLELISILGFLVSLKNYN